MTHGASELSCPVRWPVITKYFGQVCLVVAALTTVPTVVAILDSEFKAAMAYASVVTGTVAVGAICYRRFAEGPLQRNEALVISCLTFLFVAVSMTLPFMTFGLSISDALFESVSAVTTTGLTTLTTVKDRPQSFLFARAWMQWYGGLGMVVFSVALIPQSGVAAKSLMLSDGSDSWSLGGVKLHARRILVVYSTLTIVAFSLIAMHGVGIGNALFYALTSVSTGGFAPHDASLRDLGGWTVQFAVSLVCLCAAMPLFSYYRSLRLNWKLVFLDKQVRAVLVATLIVSLAMFLCLARQSNLGLGECLADGILLGISAQSTTGFESIQVASLDNASKAVLLWPMFVGAGVGSSAGGLKVLRFLILVQLLRTQIVRVNLPRHAIAKPRLFGQPLGQREIEEASLLLVAYLILAAISWLPFVLLGYDPLDSLFEVISACGTVGLSAGVTNQQLPLLLKFVLCSDMLLGRLEVFAWLVFLSQRTWFGNR